MKYLCLIYEDRFAGKTLPQAEIEKAMKEYWVFEDSIKKSGQVAARIPSARWGGVEVRPIHEYERP